MDAPIDQLVDSASAGNESAMQTLYEMNHHRILRMAFGYSRNQEDAEEIMQETFVKAFTALKKNKLRQNRHFSSWLYRIGINTAMDWVTRQRRHQLEQQHFMPSAEHPEMESPEEATLRGDIKMHIDRAVRNLSAKQRMIFNLKHYQHLKIREIAEHLKCSEGNVKRHLFRAVRRLQQDLGPEMRQP